MHKLKKWLLWGSLLCAVLFIEINFELNYPKVQTETFITNKLPADTELRILQITDFHNHHFPRQGAMILGKVRALEPNLIVITGDLVDAKTRDYDDVYTFVEQLVRINTKVYYVPGNHEWRSRRLPELEHGLQSRGVTILQNCNASFVHANVKVNLCGADDAQSHHADTAKAFAGIDQRNYTILLTHAPQLALRELNLPADLILCGHTHGGQVRLPFIGAVVVPGQKLFPEYDKGVFQLRKGQTLYIDSGMGTSNQPLRFLNRSQMSLLTVKGE